MSDYAPAYSTQVQAFSQGYSSVMQAPLLYNRSEITTVANLRKGGFYFFLGKALLPKKDNLSPEIFYALLITSFIYHTFLLSFSSNLTPAFSLRRCRSLLLMTGNWIKFIYERDTYVVNLDCISTFVRAANGRLMFWLPNAKVPIVIHPQSNPDAYWQVLEYIIKKIEKQ